MEFRQLVYFVAVAEELHFRRAAERLHVVQPAVSQQIARLEIELGVELFSRSKRQVELTDAGWLFLEEAREILNRRDRAMDFARRAALGKTGRLDVAYVGPATYSVLHTAIREYRTRFPGVDLTVQELTTGRQLELLADRTIDIGFARLPIAGHSIRSERLFMEQIIVALPELHPAARFTAVDLATLADDPFIMVPRELEPTSFDRYIGCCLEAGFSPSVVQEVRQIHTTVGLVAAGLGVALIPASLSNLQRPGVVYRALKPSSLISLDTGLVWRKLDTAPVLRQFIQAVRDIVQVDENGFLAPCTLSHEA